MINPKKVKKGYKLFRIDRYEQLHSLFVNSADIVPIGVWLPAECGELLPSGKVKAKMADFIS